jgi:hypothetical protein
MSITFDLIINPIVLFFAGVLGIIIGYAVAKTKLARAKAEIKRMENDILTSNKETLEAQRAYLELEARLQDQSIPVIAMKISGKEPGKDKSPGKEKATK